MNAFDIMFWVGTALLLAGFVMGVLHESVPAMKKNVYFYISAGCIVVAFILYVIYGVSKNDTEKLPDEVPIIEIEDTTNAIKK